MVMAPSSSCAYSLRLMRYLPLAALLVFFIPTLAYAQGAPCGGPFSEWLATFRQQALSQGISETTLKQTASLMKVNSAVLANDRGQSVFTQSFVEFASRMADGYRLPQSKDRVKKHSATFKRIEHDYGVPASVIVAFWALETDFGANLGKTPTISALTTLAHDCRRPELFRPQLLAALRILQDGDLSLAQMKGPFAGELGQLQFLPTHYLDYAVDYDGDGRRDLIGSTADALASAANYAVGIGWKRGEPWLQEVQVPSELPWEQSGLDIQHPRSQWAAWRVKRIDGGTLEADEMPASLVLPMGRTGPAFLAYSNFLQVYLEWNKSFVYAMTAAYLATRIDGQPQMTVRGKIRSLKLEEIKALQEELTRHGHEVGKIDGVLGAKTRMAVREGQRKLGLPADGYPTAELLHALRAKSRP